MVNGFTGHEKNVTIKLFLNLGSKVHSYKKN